MFQFINKAAIEYIYRGRVDEVIPDDVTVITIHCSVKRVLDHAFYWHTRLEIVKLHKDVTNIGETAFYCCVNLREINLHDSSVEVIGGGAFNRCVSLKAVKLPPSLKRINEYAFGECASLIVINLFTCSLLEEIGPGAFSQCTSLMALYFPKSLQRIGDGAFCRCHSLIAAELPKTVQVNDRAFQRCRTLELRQTQVEYNNLTDDQRVQRSHENIRWLKVRYDNLSIHKICSDPDITQDQLRPLIRPHSNINTNINHTLLQTDEIHMTALHVLCLNPNATPEIFKMIANACPQAATIQLEMVTQVEYDVLRNRMVDETREMVTPIKLWLKVKGIPYDDVTDFNEEGYMTLDTALQKGFDWNGLLTTMSIQSYYRGLGEQNEESRLYPFMQVATVGNADCYKKMTGRTENENNDVGSAESKLSNSHISSLKATEKDECINYLELVYHLAVYDPKLIYHVFEILPPISN